MKLATLSKAHDHTRADGPELWYLQTETERLILGQTANISLDEAADRVLQGGGVMETVRIRRHDKPGQEFEVPLSDLRWGVKTGFPTLAWGQTSEEPRPGDVPYLRKSADARMCVRVDVLPSLAQGFRYFLNVPLEGEPQGVCA
jgi:hypothetical protein